MKGKRGIEIDYLIWMIIGIAVLAVVIMAYFLARSKGVNLIDSIKNLFGFGFK